MSRRENLVAKTSASAAEQMKEEPKRNNGGQRKESGPCETPADLDYAYH
jgi:hypothetical protein